ncbi:hypothetical protein BpHYR1_045012 [Brachionus plicatilis]|uniref:Uncharacterized protein n=1 Tax=Brachionus plicatilis TaxID=10195 RepID=A0A3M7PW92_BRAPC|nr:hypothetical protein BpHYR1_045012 [Brachionus plicatilis]
MSFYLFYLKNNSEINSKAVPSEVGPLFSLNNLQRFCRLLQKFCMKFHNGINKHKKNKNLRRFKARL